MAECCYLDTGLTENASQSVTGLTGERRAIQVRRFCSILEQLSGSELCTGSAQEGPSLVRFCADSISIRTYDPREDGDNIGTMRGGHDGYSISEVWPHETAVIPSSRRLRAKLIESCRTSAIKRAKQWWTNTYSDEEKQAMSLTRTIGESLSIGKMRSHATPKMVRQANGICRYGESLQDARG